MDAARRLMEVFISRFDPRELPQTYPPEDEWRDRAYDELSRAMDEASRDFPPGVDRNAVLDLALNEAVALGALEYFLDNQEITDVYVNGPDQVLVEKNGELLEADFGFSNADFLYLVAQRLLSMQGYAPNTTPPHSEVRFGDGTLVSVVLPPAAVGSPLITVRKPRRGFPSLNDLVSEGVLSQGMASFLSTAIEAQRTILVAGPAGSGRTTLLNALASLVPDGSRLVAVEGTSMLQLPQRSAISLEAQPESPYGQEVSTATLVEVATRMRADRLIVDSLKGREALGFLEACAAGASGSFAAVNGVSAQDALRRVEHLCLLAGEGMGSRGLYQQVARAFDVVVVLHRFGGGKRRVVEVAEICGATTHHVDRETVFVFEMEGMGERGEGAGAFKATGYVPRFFRELESGGARLDNGIFRD